MAKNEIINKILVNAAKNPEKIAFEIYKEDCLTYEDISNIYHSFAVFFNASPIKKHERIALITEQALFILPLAISIMEHATYVSIEPELNSESILDLVKLYNADYILTEEVNDSILGVIQETGIGLINFSIEGKDIEYNLIKQPEFNTRLPMKHEDLAYINKTSGTTSTPKLIPIDYKGMWTRLQRAIYDYDIKENDVIIQAIKMNRVTSVIAAIRLLFINGSVIATEGIIPEKIIHILENRLVNNFDIPPAGLVALNQYLTSRNIKLELNHKLDIFSTGSALNPAVIEGLQRSIRARVIKRYGMTEVSSIASTFRTPEGYKPDSVGILDDIDVKIMEHEICVGGRTGFNGYENAPNEEAFVDGWFRTGDTGYLDEEGYLFITGRIKEMINRGGEKISPFELEAILLQNSSIDDVAIFPYPGASGSDEVGAAVIFKKNQSCSLSELRAYLKDRISPFKMPTLMYAIQEFPKSTENKIQRKMLYEQLSKTYVAMEEKLDSRDPINEELTDTVRILKKIWLGILGLETLSIDDGFIELGGDSLKAAALYTEATEAFKQNFLMDLFYQHHTIRTMAGFIDSTKEINEKYFHLVPMRSSVSTNTPLIFIHAFDGELANYHVLLKHLNTDRKIYGLRLNFDNPALRYPLTINALARAYTDEIVSAQPEGPYFFCGLSFGGLLAIEIARILKQEGRQIKLIVALDTGFSIVLPKLSLKNKFKNFYDVDNNQFARASLLIKINHIILKSFKLFWLKVDKLIFLKRRVNRGYQAIAAQFKKKKRAIDEKQRQIILRDAGTAYSLRSFDFPILYFRALKNPNQEGIRLLKEKAQFVIEIAMDCQHDDFVKGSFAYETARHMERHLQE